MKVTGTDALLVCVAHVSFVVAPDKICQPVGEPYAWIFAAVFVTTGDVGMELEFTPALCAEAVFEGIAGAGSDGSIIEYDVYTIVLFNYVDK